MYIMLVETMNREQTSEKLALRLKIMRPACKIKNKYEIEFDVQSQHGILQDSK